MNYWLESRSHKDTVFSEILGYGRVVHTPMEGIRVVPCNQQKDCNGPIAACNDLQDPQPTNQTRDTVIDGKRSLMITEGIHWLINGFLPQL